MAKTLAEKIAVMRAAELGEKIQGGSHPTWFDCANPQWNWEYCDYRVAPKEPRKFHAYVTSRGGRSVVLDGHISEVSDLYKKGGWKEFVNLIEVLPETK